MPPPTMSSILCDVQYTVYYHIIDTRVVCYIFIAPNSGSRQRMSASG